MPITICVATVLALVQWVCVTVASHMGSMRTQRLAC